MHGNYSRQGTFHSLSLPVTSFGEDVVKISRETSQTSPAFERSLGKLWCSRWESKPTPSHPSFESAADDMDPAVRPDGPTPLCMVAEPPSNSFAHSQAASGQATGSSHVFHSTLSTGQAQWAEWRTQLQPALWTSLPPRGLHQDLNIIWTPVFSWLIFYLLPETVFLGSWIKSHSAPAN